MLPAQRPNDGADHITSVGIPVTDVSTSAVTPNCYDSLLISQTMNYFNILGWKMIQRPQAYVTESFWIQTPYIHPTKLAARAKEILSFVNKSVQRGRVRVFSRDGKSVSVSALAFKGSINGPWDVQSPPLASYFGFPLVTLLLRTCSASQPDQRLP
jgi:hypothetical protein